MGLDASALELLSLSELRAIARRLSASTSPPWCHGDRWVVFEGDPQGPVAPFRRPEDAAFTRQAPYDIARLLSEAAALSRLLLLAEGELGRLREKISFLEFALVDAHASSGELTAQQAREVVDAQIRAFEDPEHLL